MTDFNFYEEKSLESVTMSELQGMVTAYAAKRKEKEAIADTLSEKNAEIDALEAKIMSVLEAHNQEKFSVTGIGTIYTSNKYQVSYPKDPEQAAKVREFCLANGLENELTINHNKLNALYKSKKEEHELSGNLDLSNVIPGIGEPKVHKTIGLRRG